MVARLNRIEVYCAFCGEIFTKWRINKRHGTVISNVRPTNARTCSKRCSSKLWKLMQGIRVNRND